MFEAVENPYRVPFNGSFRVKNTITEPQDDAPGKKQCRKRLEAAVDQLRDLQRILYARDRHAILLVFQAMDGTALGRLRRSARAAQAADDCDRGRA